VIEQRTVHPSEDAVCGMAVDLVNARASDLVLTHGDIDYSFCSEGCLLEFRDDPAWFLDPAYAPTAM
jgi:YHS domain-containing protein